MEYQIVYIRGDQRNVVARFPTRQQAETAMGIYRTALGRYVIEKV